MSLAQTPGPSREGSLEETANPSPIGLGCSYTKSQARRPAWDYPGF